MENSDDSESDNVYNESKNEIDDNSDSSNEESDNDKDDLLNIGSHPDLSTVLPTFISKFGDKYTKLIDDIQDVALSRLIDTAQSLADYNHKRDDYQQSTNKLENTMNKLLKLARDMKVEQCTYNRIAKEIREEKLDDNHDDNNNPIKTNNWSQYLQISRDNVSTEIESGAAKDEESGRIKRFVAQKTSDYKQQFQEATIVETIQNYDSDDTQNINNNNNNNNNNNKDNQDEEDIVIDTSSKNINVGSIKCPLTMKIFNKPLKSKQCGHTFEKDAIFIYLKDKEKQNELAKCPLPGCTNIITNDQLIRDVKIEKLIKKQSRNNQNNESDDDDAAFDLTL